MYAHHSLQNNAAAQMFINEYRYLYVKPIDGRGEAPDAIRSFIDDVGIPEVLDSDNAK